MTASGPSPGRCRRPCRRRARHRRTCLAASGRFPERRTGSSRASMRSRGSSLPFAVFARAFCHRRRRAARAAVELGDQFAMEGGVVARNPASGWAVDLRSQAGGAWMVDAANATGYRSRSSAPGTQVCRGGCGLPASKKGPPKRAFRTLRAAEGLLRRLLRHGSGAIAWRQASVGSGVLAASVAVAAASVAAAAAPAAASASKQRRWRQRSCGRSGSWRRLVAAAASPAAAAASLSSVGSSGGGVGSPARWRQRRQQRRRRRLRSCRPTERGRQRRGARKAWCSWFLSESCLKWIRLRIRQRQCA